MIKADDGITRKLDLMKISAAENIKFGLEKIISIHIYIFSVIFHALEKNNLHIYFYYFDFFEFKINIYVYI